MTFFLNRFVRDEITTSVVAGPVVVIVIVVVDVVVPPSDPIFLLDHYFHWLQGSVPDGDCALLVAMVVAAVFNFFCIRFFLLHRP